jgi:hypothetical protein
VIASFDGDGLPVITDDEVSRVVRQKRKLAHRVIEWVNIGRK